MDLSKTFPEKVAGAILIDMPNVVNAGYDVIGERYRISNTILIREFSKTLGLHVPVMRRMYTQEGSDPILNERWRTHAEPWWNVRGFEIVVPPANKKDIDSCISFDMGEAAVRAIQQEMKKLRIVLASGDGVYARAYRALQELHRGTLELELIVYSWSELFSRELIKSATAGNAHIFENVPGLVIPHGRQQGK